MDREPHQFSPFARLLRARRKALRLSQDQLARLAGEGIIASYIAKLEHDDVETPPPERLRAIARALQTPIDDFAVRLYRDPKAPLPEPLVAPAPPPSRVLSDPHLPDDIKAAIRHLVPDVPDDELYALARSMAAVQRERAAEAEAAMGPPGRLPPHSQQSRNGGTNGHAGSHDGAVG